GDRGNLRPVAQSGGRAVQRSHEAGVIPASRALAAGPPLAALARSPIASGRSAPPSVRVPAPAPAAAPVLTLPPVPREVSPSPAPWRPGRSPPPTAGRTYRPGWPGPIGTTSSTASTRRSAGGSGPSSARTPRPFRTGRESVEPQGESG